MDRKIVDKRLIKPRHMKIGVGVILFVLMVIFITFRNPVSTYRIDKDKVSISSVQQGEFKDYISETGQVVPISTVYLDAIEGGRVERIVIEEGAMVNQGDVILELSNHNLNLTILDSEAQLAEKSNFLREVRISMEQQKLVIEQSLLQTQYELKTKKRKYLQNKQLYADGFIAKEEYILAEENYQMARDFRELMVQRKAQDSLFREIQVAQLETSLENMQKNLSMVNKRIEHLKVKAPVDGQLGLLDAELGQSVNIGQRLGQINVLSAVKIRAEIDEHYIDRVRTGLKAYFERNTDTFALKIKKVYPEVRDGQFIVDMVFEDEVPDNIRIGQSHYVKLELGQPRQSLLLSKGGFYQSSGGQWVYVLDPTGEFALRREVQIGRQNPQYYEVLEGLNAGEKVIVSNYDMFGDNERVVFK
ncbi:MAG: efflux RND transporter periplasmic adaptor subunit [Bacteroidota bacterium]